MKTPLNRENGHRIVTFFDTCFKQGVIDAYEFGDDYGVKEFIAQHKRDFVFGILGSSDDFDWQVFRFALYRWARASRLKALAEGYIYEIRKKDNLWCLLPFCLRFYIMGMEEWLRYPSPVGIEIFKKEMKVHWDPNEKVRKMSTFDFISYMHEFAYDYCKLPEEKQPVKPIVVDGYCRAIYDLTRKYAQKKNSKASAR